MPVTSSYRENNFGHIFYHHIISYPPAVCVELGVLHGYSTFHIAKGLKDAKEKYQNNGHLHAFDLWEDYKYKHGDMKEVQDLLDKEDLTEYVTLYKEDAFEAHKRFENDSVDVLHVDLSNDGKIFEKIFDLWDTKLRYGSLLMFEGGSEERDKVDWMINYKKKPIRPAILDHAELNRRYHYGIIRKFPSLSLFVKKIYVDERGKVQ
jgi:hypothetical protein